jgi:cell division protein FtsW (lipid II flippase)
MLTDILNFFGAERYSQHSICLTNDPLMIFLYVLSDLSTFASYVAIGVSLLFVSRVPPTRIRPPMRLLFGAFIFLCGLSHLTSVITLFAGVYRLDVLVRAAMAAVSVVTAISVVHDYLRGRQMGMG